MNIPDVLKHARPKTRAVFWHLLRNADGKGLVQLHANEIADELGISRRTVYYSIKFLRKCNLATMEQSLLGRGKHSVLRMLWKARKAPKKQKVCIALKRYKDLNTLPGDTDFKYAMMHFRKLLNQSPLWGNEVKRCMQAIGKAIRGKDKAFKDRLWHYLSPIIPALSTPKWCWDDPNKVYPWFTAIIRKSMIE